MMLIKGLTVANCIASSVPVGIQNAAGTGVCTIDNNGYISCGSAGVLTTASGYTQTQIDNKIAAAVSAGYTFNSPLSKSGTIVSIDLAA